MHYRKHETEFFYGWLVEYIQCYDSIILSVNTPYSIEYLRKRLGHTIVEEADPKSIRGMYGLYDGMNGLHLSESDESGEEEVHMWTRSGILEEGKPKFDAEAYILRNIGKPDKSLAIHAVISRYKGDDSPADREVKAEVLSLLRMEAEGIERKTVEGLVEYLWQGMNLRAP